MTKEQHYSIIPLSKVNPCFISIWDEEIGPKIEDFYPKKNIGDIEDLAIQIFTTYQHFWDLPEEKFESASFILPVPKINKKARVILETISNPEVRGQFQPFIVVLLVPEYFSKFQIKKFDDLLIKIAQDYSHSRYSPKEEFTSLEHYYQDIKYRFEIIEFEREEEPEISEFYSYTAAVEDFKAAVNLFKKSKYQESYVLLKKVLAKFTQEKHDRLRMEVIYLIGSIFVQEKKYKNARLYFKQLEDLAIRFDHQRFLETGLFMNAFCYYNNQSYDKALEKLQNLEKYKLIHVNNIRYLIIFGKTLAYLKNYEEAERKYLKALKFLENVSDKNNETQFAYLNYELGLIHYRKAFEITKNLDLYKNNDVQVYLEKAISFFNESAKSIEKSENQKDLPQIYSLISNINEVLDNREIALNYLYKAFNSAKEQGKFQKILSILFKLIKIHVKRNEFGKSIQLIKDFLIEYDNSRVLDLYAKGLLYEKLGRFLIKSEKENEGLEKLTKAHAIFNQISTPLSEDLNLLIKIRSIYKKHNKSNKITEISNQIKKLSKNLENIEKKEPKNVSPLGEVKEIWFFSADAGLLLYSYAPMTEVDHDLVGGFLTALKQLSIEVTQQQLSSITVGTDRYSLYQEEGQNLFILGRSNIRSNERKVNKILGIIYSRFLKEYSGRLKKFSGNVGFFHSFDSIIQSFDFSLIY
ncbi:MAG: hypothetical protein EU541_03325 [Promethearchaeota archaeon]|nr:MAG: hypothetical protein EU541_03325 [Candidatus Lokiarchaeota archaeon]